MTCHCFCAAAHPEVGICDVEAPRALLTVDTTESALGHDGEREIVVCKPCGEATFAANPRGRCLVVLDADSDASR